ncbi:MAG: enoyl-CoA hydratase family protein [Acidimicrobiales bacterium]
MAWWHVMPTADALVQVEIDGAIATITLDSPSNRNALSRRLVDELGAAFDTARDPGVRAVVLTATGTVFCSGADLSEAAGAGGGATGFASVLETLWEFPKTVVAKLNGHVRAGGLGLVAAADIVVAPTTATFAFAEVRIGVAPAMIAVLCCRRMTPRAVGRYLLTGERFDADAAAAAGLVTVVAEPGTVERCTAELLDQIKGTEPNAVATTKQLVRDLAALDVPAGLRHAEGVSQALFASPEAAEGIAAFKEKRPPRWQV